MTSHRARILVVDDDENTRTVLHDLFASRGYEVITARTPDQALAAASDIDTIILDVRLEKANGIELIADLKQRQPETPVIMISGYSTIENAVEAIKRGAYDYVRKPLDYEEFLLRVEKAVTYRRLTSQVQSLKTELGAAYGYGNIIGESPAMRRVFDLIRRVAASDAAVLITGESGTGKELVAQAIHGASHRADAPFQAINCSAVPETLLESELFGHVRGAFTGAYRDKQGLFTEAGGGTVFLDEIGEMPLPIQAKLLRVLQDGEVRPLGGTATARVDVRVISATNKDLQERIGEKRFREDLYYRVSVFPIRLPSLRERPEDIPLLANHFIRKHQKRMRGQGPTTLSPTALQKLLSHDWPGNVRELENRIEQAMVLGTGRTIQPADIIFGGETMAAKMRTFRESKAEFEKDYAIRVLTATHGNVAKAAKIAGKHRTDFYYLMRKYRIKARPFRARRSK